MSITANKFCGIGPWSRRWSWCRWCSGWCPRWTHSRSRSRPWRIGRPSRPLQKIFAVWPDVGIKSDPNVPQSCRKLLASVLTLVECSFKRAHKVTIYLGYFWTNIGHHNFVKRPICSHWFEEGMWYNIKQSRRVRIQLKIIFKQSFLIKKGFCSFLQKIVWLIARNKYLQWLRALVSLVNTKFLVEGLEQLARPNIETCKECFILSTTKLSML